MHAPSHRKRQTPRTWLIPAIVAAILFIGAVASNLIANYIQPRVEPYRPWVWVSFVLALIVAVAFAIREALRAANPAASNEAAKLVDIKIDGDVVARDKIVHIHTGAPPLSTLHQLPPPVNDFTGRAEELAELTEKLEQGGITISGFHGLGGIGKTALALKLADELKPRFPDAQFYLDLKGTSQEPLAVNEALAHVIHAFHPTAKLPETEAELRGFYQSVLQDQRALIVMDNAANAGQVEPLIPPSGCVMLVTSRAHFSLPGLFAKNLETLSLEDARDLLLTIAPRIGDVADEIARLCGYLPLALRLAATALVKFVNLSPKDYARRLENEQKRLDLIEASLSLSYQLLSEDLKKLWRLLAIFPHTFSNEAAAALWNVAVANAQDILGELIAVSVVEWNEAAGRYRLHDLVRLFASSRLNKAERRSAQRSHSVHYLRVLGEAFELYREGGEAIMRGLMWFDLEWRNIQAGQSWAAAQTGTADEWLCIAYTELGADLLQLRQHPRAQIDWLESSLEAARRLKNRVSEGVALGNLGNAYAVMGDTQKAIEYYEQALRIDRETGDRTREGMVIGNLGVAYMNLGETRRALEFYEQRLAIAREVRDRRGEGIALSCLGNAYASLGVTKRAIEFLEQHLRIAREMGDRRSEGFALGSLGHIYLELRETKRAIELLEKQLLIAREIGDRRAEAAGLGGLGMAYLYQLNPGAAIMFLEEQLVIARDIGDRRSEGAALGNLATAYGATRKSRQAIKLNEHHLAISREMGDRSSEGTALWNMSLILDQLGERARAIRCAEEALTIREQIEDPHAAQVRAQLEEWKASGNA